MPCGRAPGPDVGGLQRGLWIQPGQGLRERRPGPVQECLAGGLRLEQSEHDDVEVRVVDRVDHDERAVGDRGEDLGHALRATPADAADEPARHRAGVAHRRERPRSTTYGAPYDPNAISAHDDDVARGIYFIFISAKAMSTLEFLQQEWINNGNFMNLGDERDPNVGLQEGEATFTIPQHPVRRRIHDIETFNVLRGGEYFFMPSLSALRWIADTSA